jgi:hypothetical protein
VGTPIIVLPSPLTRDPHSEYGQELEWLDAGLQAVRNLKPEVPIFATVAISDTCLQFTPAAVNPLLASIMDAVGAREVDGVYIVLEQATESDFGRHCTASATLRPLLEMVRIFTADCGKRVGVSYAGAFGLACLGAGAEFWSSGWYKSSYRLRLTEGEAEGFAVPSYWCTQAAIDIHLAEEFDMLVAGGRLPSIEDVTAASELLLRAARLGRSSNAVVPWQYRKSNIVAADEHFLLAMQKATARLVGLSPAARIAAIDEWLRSAEALAAELAAVIDDRLRGTKQKRKTRTEHVTAWRAAVESYRRDHQL